MSIRTTIPRTLTGILWKHDLIVQAHMDTGFIRTKFRAKDFICPLFRKREPAGARNKNQDSLKAGRRNRVSRTAEKQLKNWIQDDAVCYIPVGDAIHGLPEGSEGDFDILKNALYLKKAGVRIGREGENSLDS